MKIEERIDKALRLAIEFTGDPRVTVTAHKWTVTPYFIIDYIVKNFTMNYIVKNWLYFDGAKDLKDLYWKHDLKDFDLAKIDKKPHGVKKHPYRYLLVNNKPAFELAWRFWHLLSVLGTKTLKVIVKDGVPIVYGFDSKGELLGLCAAKTLCSSNKSTQKSQDKTTDSENEQIEQN